MATCEQCGAPQEGNDDFCGACGAFTAWGRDRTATPPTSAVVVEGETPGDGEKPGAESGTEPGEAAGPGATPKSEAPAAAAALVAPVAPVAVGGPVTAVAPALTAPMPRTAASPPGPGDPVPPTASAPEPAPGGAGTAAAVRPAKPTLERVERRYAAPDEHVRAPDDVDCAGCATANPAGRRFCRRCGSALDVPAAQESASWWQRLVQRLRDGRRRRRLGRRSGGVATARRAVIVLLVLGVLGGGGYLAAPHVTRLLGGVRDRVADATPVTPRTVKASSSAPGHPAAYAADGTWNWWAPKNPAKGQWVEAEFAGRFNLLHIVVLSGSSQRQDDFLKQARPSVLELKAWVARGKTVTRRIPLQDKYGSQAFPLAIPGVTRVRLTIVSAYGEAPGRLTAMGELEFRTRR